MRGKAAFVAVLVLALSAAAALASTKHNYIAHGVDDSQVRVKVVVRHAHGKTFVSKIVAKNLRYSPQIDANCSSSGRIHKLATPERGLRARIDGDGKFSVADTIGTGSDAEDLDVSGRILDGKDARGKALIRFSQSGCTTQNAKWSTSA